MVAEESLRNRSFFLANEDSFVKGTPTYPYRNYFYGVGIMREGYRRIRIGFQDFEVEPNTVLVIGPGIIRQWLDNEPNNVSNAIFFSADLFVTPFENSFLHDFSFFKTGIDHVIKVSDGDFEVLADFFELMKKNEKNEKIVSGLTFSMLEKLTTIYAKTNSNTNSSRQQTIVRDFQDLVHKHYLEQKEVTFYAQKLSLSAKHLSETVKEQTGKSAKKWIDEIVLFEAKSLLKQTAMSVKEIVYWLGYDDASYFNKVFRENEGVTPMVYRKG
jgi:AraC-like DNA-binding protein